MSERLMVVERENQKTVILVKLLMLAIELIMEKMLICHNSKCLIKVINHH